MCSTSTAGKNRLKTFRGADVGLAVLGVHLGRSRSELVSLTVRRPARFGFPEIVS